MKVMGHDLRLLNDLGAVVNLSKSILEKQFGWPSKMGLSRSDLEPARDEEWVASLRET